MDFNRQRLIAINLNLEEPETSTKIDLWQMVVTYLPEVGPAFVAVFIFLSIFFITSYQSHDLVHQISQYQKIMETSQMSGGLEIKEREEREGRDSSERTYLEILKKRDGLLPLMRDISNGLPSLAWLNELSVKEGYVLIRGTASDALIIADFVRALGASPLIASLEIKGVNQLEESGVYLQSFSLQASLSGGS